MVRKGGNRPLSIVLWAKIATDFGYRASTSRFRERPAVSAVGGLVDAGEPERLEHLPVLNPDVGVVHSLLMPRKLFLENPVA